MTQQPGAMRRPGLADADGCGAVTALTARPSGELARRIDTLALDRGSGGLGSGGAGTSLAAVHGMRVESEKFNTVLDVPDDCVIRFPRGLIGFTEETEFVLLEREQSPKVGWLQSVRTPTFAIPVVSSHELTDEYPDVPLGQALFSESVIPVGDDTAVMLVLTCQKGMLPTVNMVSPIVVDAERRVGTQIILRGSRFAAREVLALRPEKMTIATGGIAP